MKKRIGQHSNGLVDNHEVDLICAVRGHQSDEKAVHRHFQGLLIENKDEVFRPEDELTDYLRWLRNQWFVAVDVEDTSASAKEYLPMKASSEWLPDKSRSLSRDQSKYPLFGGGDDNPLFFAPREVTADDFYTSPIIINASREAMGGIDLDPASHAVANRKVQAATIYTVNDNGLARPWYGRIWLNPPFSQWQQWVPKILAEWDSGGVKSMCVLSAMRTLTAQYFSPMLESMRAMCLIRGRIKFWGDRAGDSPDDGHCVFYFGPDVDAFRKAFSPLGVILCRAGELSNVSADQLHRAIATNSLHHPVSH